MNGVLSGMAEICLCGMLSLKKYIKKQHSPLVAPSLRGSTTDTQGVSSWTDPSAVSPTRAFDLLTAICHNVEKLHTFEN